MVFSVGNFFRPSSHGDPPSWLNANWSCCWKTLFNPKLQVYSIAKPEDVSTYPVLLVSKGGRPRQNCLFGEVLDAWRAFAWRSSAPRMEDFGIRPDMPRDLRRDDQRFRREAFMTRRLSAPKVNIKWSRVWKSGYLVWEVCQRILITKWVIKILDSQFRISPRNLTCKRGNSCFQFWTRRKLYDAISTQASSFKIAFNSKSIAIQLEELNFKYFTRDLNPSEVLKKLVIRNQ